MAKFSLTSWQSATIYNPFDHFGMYGGVATGKTFSGCHFAIRMIREHPDKTGFIGANTSDQMSQATLRELFYWLEQYGFEYVMDCLPPAGWGPRKLKSYKNTVLVRNKKTGKVTLVFTRVLSKGDNLRGMEFSWYWIDETRDTPNYTHDVILARMRETNLQKGLITTTTNGKGWDYERFVKGNNGNGMYGSLHVATIKSLEAGIITEKYYNTMKSSYSPLMALQELDALHVNIYSGRAYHSAGDWNRRSIAPWGDRTPNPDRPLILGCDFNYAPAPMVWLVGQVSPFGDAIHWFREVADVQCSSEDMARRIALNYPGFMFQVYGDASGGKGTTSNAGIHDYAKMSTVWTEMGVMHTIDYDQGNPRVKDRVENHNRLLKDYTGAVRITYDPVLCPHLDKDYDNVGWKKIVNGRDQGGKLDDGGDKELTHASDGGGYALWKLFPWHGGYSLAGNITSPHR